MDKLWLMTGCFLCIILSSDFVKYVHLMTTVPITNSETRTLHCLPNEYGDNCTYCSPKDTCLDGHFTCDYSTGEKICLPGWSGKSCRTRTEPDMTFVSCPDNQCRNGGTCVSGQCCCVDGFTGILCEIEIIECTNTSCSNGGICKDLIGRYECLCRPNYSGEQCEIPAASGSVQTTPHNDATCSHDTCLNNGTCFEDAIFTYCLCPTWFTGARCETSLKPQQSVANTSCPAKHYGPSCTDVCVETDSCTDGHYVCNKVTGEKVCKSGWIGDNCDTRMLPPQLDPYCPSGLGCKNDGQCYMDTCCCRQGYTGYLCEVQSIGCISSPCLHNGTCIETGDDAFMCLCGEGLSGLYCDVDLFTLTTPSSVSTALSAVSSSFLSLLPSSSTSAIPTSNNITTIAPSFAIDTSSIYSDTGFATSTHVGTNISPSSSFQLSKDISASESSLTESIQSLSEFETSILSEVSTNILGVISSSSPRTDVDFLNSAYSGVIASTSIDSLSISASTIDLTLPSTITTYSTNLAELTTNSGIVPSPSLATSSEVLKSVKEDSSSIYHTDLPTMISYSQSLSESPDVFYTSSSIYSQTPSLQNIQSSFSSEHNANLYTIDMSFSSIDFDTYQLHSQYTVSRTDVESTSAFNKIHQTDYHVTDNYDSVTNTLDSAYISNSDSHNIAMSSFPRDRISSKEQTSYFSNPETTNPSTYYQPISHETSTYSVIESSRKGTTPSLLLEGSLKPNSALTLPQITSTPTKLGLQSNEITSSLSTSESVPSFIDTPGLEISSSFYTSSSVETFSSLLKVSTPSLQITPSSLLSSTNGLNTQTNTAVPSYIIDHTYHSIASSVSVSHFQTSYNPNFQTSSELISTYEIKPTSVKESANSLANENVSTILNTGITKTGLSPSSSESVVTDSVTPTPISMSAVLSSRSALISLTENSRQFLSATTLTGQIPISTSLVSSWTSSLQESRYSTDINLASQTISSETPADLSTDDGDSLVWWIVLLIVLAVVVIGVSLVILAIVVVRKRRSDFRAIEQNPEAIHVLGRSDFRAIEQNPEAILGYDKEHFSFQPDIANPTFEPDDSDDDSVKHDIYVVNK